MNNLRWEKEKDTFLLKNDEEILISLDYKPISGSVFKISGAEYQIVKSGTWATLHTVLLLGKPILKLTQGFWGSKGTSVFLDGCSYQLIYGYKGGFNLSFHDQGKELLVYQTEFEKNRPKMSFNLGSGLIDADKLLVLSALGLTIFYQVFSENSSGEDVTILLTIL